MNCIICTEPVLINSLEHIVPESLGNKTYTLELGTICSDCNNSFSKFEDKALSKGILAMARPMTGYPTKKGKAAKASSHDLRFEGDQDFKENRITVFGLNEGNVKKIHPNGSLEVEIKDFDKNEVAVSKLLLKIAYESMFQSQRRLFKSLDLSSVRLYLDKKNNTGWPFVTTDLKPDDFISIPKYNDKRALKSINCEIRYKAVNEICFLINFRYKFLSYLINLQSRDTTWVSEYLKQDKLANIYLQGKLKK